jgi:hypothetical protein
MIEFTIEMQATRSRKPFARKLLTMTLENIRTVTTTDGNDTRELTVYFDPDRGFLLHDSRDINFDSLEPIADDSDSSISDAIRDNGFEIVSVTQ